MKRVLLPLPTTGYRNDDFLAAANDARSLGCNLKRLNVLVSLRLALKLPKVKRLLHPQPTLRRRIGQSADTDSHIRREGALLDLEHGARAPH